MQRVTHPPHRATIFGADCHRHPEAPLPDTEPPPLPPHLRAARARWMANALEEKAKRHPQDADRLNEQARKMRLIARVFEWRAKTQTEPSSGGAAGQQSAKDGNSDSA